MVQGIDYHSYGHLRKKRPSKKVQAEPRRVCGIIKFMQSVGEDIAIVKST
ncbi:hypothetical protein BkAM31D_25150 [Halalkalibacter krulwichiae]|uniref:Uncharacterized protein n=1 Tax=Halalkalibacter krulwichiae TaxID=199441 RepID=A0A1X9MHE4_9BACI|nr:hypothetical protein BkAM31D_25150 [Halalkalibacter krulwichiae]